MSYDIYGNHLRRGYCEVHPDIPEPWPCYLCLEANRYQNQEQLPYPDPRCQPTIKEEKDDE